ncbi:MAG TPA: hypothetical protein VH560_15775, partial [Polyangia bacterium]|nr:hypothetical protein [Polyangia bacterium]
MNRRVLLCVCAISLSCASSDKRPASGAAGDGGAAGAVGGAGNNGTAGANGTAGSSGTAGANGTAGAIGAAGGNGTAGANGTAGSNGTAGATGSAGKAGTAGATGSAGKAGTAGATGTAGAGTAGATGAAGAGTAGSTGAAGAVVINNGACGHLLPTQASESVLQRGKNSQRTAHFIEPSLTTAAVGSAKFGADTTFNTAAKFTGNLEGVPLFVAGATPGKGMYIVASHGGGNSILTAIDETTGMTVWTHVLGAAGNGVRSTPVIDANGIVYTAFDASTGGAHFEIHASSIANMGAEVTGWPVNASNITSGNGDKLGGFDVGKEIQRGALSLVNGILYVPFGGVFGDGPPYKGFVVAVNTANPTQTGAWSASGDRSGLWQGGGLASDGTSIYATTSNGSDGTHMDSEEVVRITGMGTSSHNANDVFFPSSWHTWDGQDNDFGASSPLVVSFSGACQAMVVSPSKPGHLFFLNPTNLGGSTPLRELVLATNATPGGEYKVFYAAPTAYISTSGVHLALEARTDANCPGATGGDKLVSVKVDMTTTPPTPSVAWCVGVNGGEDRHSPISTTTDGVANALVWFVQNSGLSAFDGDTGGNALFTSTPCGNVEKQTSLLAADGHVVVGADGKLCSYSV